MYVILYFVIDINVITGEMANRIGKCKTIFVPCWVLVVDSYG